jgi:hypothetical protein
MNPPVLVRRYRARAEEIGRIRHDVCAHAALAERFEGPARARGGTRIRMAFATG